jgi:alpha-tubulin suppressor-like RCC1 family protein
MDGVLSQIPTESDFVAIAAGKHLSAALRADGSIACWGHPSCLSDVPNGNGYIAIACGQAHGVALHGDGSVVTWGVDFGIPHRELGNNVVAIATKSGSSMALKEDGSIVVWGPLSFGYDEVPQGTGFAHIGSGFGHGLAIKAEGMYYPPLVGDINGPEGVPDHGVDWYDWNAMIEAWKGVFGV